MVPRLASSSKRCVDPGPGTLVVVRRPLDSFQLESDASVQSAERSRERPLDIGDCFDGRFTVSGVLGCGGAGVVYLVTAGDPPSELALKVVRFEPDTPLLRLRREGAILARLRGPHFVRVHETGVAPPWGYVLMDRLVGEDLATRLDRLHRLTTKTTLELSGQLCAALEIAHALGYVHRDIKPTNLFLERHEARERLKVLDFGIAKHFADDGRLTATDVLLGAPAYMAPEQIQDPRNVDARADLWSYAVVLYRCLVGRRPFEGGFAELLAAVSATPHEPATNLAPDLPPALDAFFARALAKLPNDRFASATELHAELVRALRPLTPLAK